MLHGMLFNNNKKRDQKNQKNQKNSKKNSKKKTTQWKTNVLANEHPTYYGMMVGTILPMQSVST